MDILSGLEIIFLHFYCFCHFGFKKRFKQELYWLIIIIGSFMSLSALFESYQENEELVKAVKEVLYYETDMFGQTMQNQIRLRAICIF